jgi:hypothetical protein
MPMPGTRWYHVPERYRTEGQEARLKITKVEPLLLDRYLLVLVHTDAGITGLGESGAWGSYVRAGPDRARARSVARGR